MVLLQATFLVSNGNNIITCNFALFVANDMNFELATTIKTKNKCSSFVLFCYFFKLNEFYAIIIKKKKHTAPIVGEILASGSLISQDIRKAHKSSDWLIVHYFVYGKCMNHKLTLPMERVWYPNIKTGFLF